MRLAKLKIKTSIEDYLEGEHISQTRHEFIDGEVYQMAGASERHHRIAFNLATKLDLDLDNSKCNTFFAEMKLNADEKTFYHPDVFVTCDKNSDSEYYREESVLIIEVTSPSTHQTDRRKKLRAYQQIPSVYEYAIVEQDKIYLELHPRQPDDRWITYFYNDADEEFSFESLEPTLKLSDVHRRVNF